jgi:hypothetical protein
VHLKIKVENNGASPIFPTKLEVLENKTLAYADDNDFLLPAGDCRELSVEVRVKDKDLYTITLELSAWNTESQRISVSL